ncbi:MAG: transcriptional regulator [Clostridiales bacterium]|nr:transcriptional regulator [Candidatus Cacconaster stercorequi]
MKNISGERFGRWTVLDNSITAANGERKWFCRCDCGTERYVLERSLLYGGSKSCGCIRKENAAKAVAHELSGKVFGDLTVIEKSSTHEKNGGIRWKCRCICGEECDISATLLVMGRKTNCGCKNEKHYAASDIAGKRFRKLVALFPTDKRTGKGSVVWHCKCDCGNEVDISYNELMYSNIQSCGCAKREHDRKLASFLTHIEGTSIEAIRSKKIPTDNTTGYRGVYNIHGKYLAKIVFQKKQYHLGKYDSIEDAVKARKEAEAVLFDSFADYYDAYKAYAENCPEWAAVNPIRLVVSKGSDGLSVSISPELSTFSE